MQVLSTPVNVIVEIRSITGRAWINGVVSAIWDVRGVARLIVEGQMLSTCLLVISPYRSDDIMLVEPRRHNVRSSTEDEVRPVRISTNAYHNSCPPLTGLRRLLGVSAK
jgi:hypothetical protein